LYRFNPSKYGSAPLGSGVVHLPVSTFGLAVLEEHLAGEGVPAAALEGDVPGEVVVPVGVPNAGVAADADREGAVGAIEEAFGHPPGHAVAGLTVVV